MTVQSVGPRIQASSTLWKSSQTVLLQRLPQWLGNKESSCNAGDAGDTGSMSGLERDCNTSRTESKLVPLGAYSEPGTSGHFIDIKSFKLCNSAVRLA